MKMQRVWWGWFAFGVIALLTANCSPPPESVEPQLDVTKQSMSVGAAASSQCSTSSVKALTQQLFEELNCIRPNTLVSFANLQGVSPTGSHVNLYLQPAAKTAMEAVLKRRPGATMTITSALRSLAQQYLLYQWYRQSRCGIGLAASPGNSNHEGGLAVDVSPYSSWRSHFQAVGWRWLGSSDPVHFDFTNSSTISLKGLSIQAFQRLWNKNNPNDKIKEDGVWGPNTESRLAKSPAGGFAKSGCCNQACTVSGQTGTCRQGILQCPAGGTPKCVPQAQPETCNNKDDDCDGQTDEGNPGGGAACTTSLKGPCAAGTQQCRQGKLECTPTQAPKAETCNDKDDDCDGQIDEGNPGGGGSCQTGQPGSCANGLQQCRQGKLECLPFPNCNTGQDAGVGTDTAPQDSAPPQDTRAPVPDQTTPPEPFPQPEPIQPPEPTQRPDQVAQAERTSIPAPDRSTGGSSSLCRSDINCAIGQTCVNGICQTNLRPQGFGCNTSAPLGAPRTLPLWMLLWLLWLGCATFSQRSKH